MSLPGVISAQPWLRLVLYGLAGTGKTMVGLTFPSPLLIGPRAEGGYGTAIHPDGSFLVMAAALGSSHAAFCRGAGGTPISEEYLAWTDELYRVTIGAPVSWRMPDGTPARRPQTLILSGFTDALALVFGEGEKVHVTEPQKNGRKGDPQKAWDAPLAFTKRVMSCVNALPMHVIVELGARDVRSEDPSKRGAIIGYKPDVPGQSANIIYRQADAILYQERAGTSYRTVFRSSSTPTKLRHSAFKNAPAQVENLSYDHFAAALGLPTLNQCDPEHPRCQPGRWPWSTHNHA